jgi:hypothetical protein
MGGKPSKGTPADKRLAANQATGPGLTKKVPGGFKKKGGKK